jgi:hypothetical protein
MGMFADIANNIYCLLIADQGKTNFCFPFLFVENKWKFAVSIFLSQQTNRSCRFPLVSFFIYIYIETAA